MSEDQHRPQPDDESSHAGIFGSVILYRLLIAVSVVLVLLILGALVARKVYRSNIPASTFAEIHRLETTQLSLPRDWHQPADLPPVDVVEFHQNLKTRMEGIRRKHEPFISGESNSMMSFYGMAQTSTPEPGLLETFQTTGTLSEAQRTSFTLLLTDLQPLIDETSAAVRLPGYSMEIDSHLLAPWFIDIQMFSKLMLILAVEQAKEGRCKEAVESALLPLRLSKRPEQSDIITHLIAVAITRMAAETLLTVCTHCSDKNTIEYALESVSALYPSLFPGDINDWFHEELVSLRYAAAYGYPVDISPQRQGNILRQSMGLWTPEYFDYVASYFTASDPRSAAASRLSANVKADIAALSVTERWTRAEYMGPTTRRIYHAVTGIDPVLLQYTWSAPNVEEATARSHVARASLDLVGLSLGESLTSGTGTSNITTYLTPPPVDPFTSGSYPFSSVINRHYSAGPDLDDDKAAVKYDPTNGTTSNGDIWLTGRW